MPNSPPYGSKARLTKPIGYHCQGIEVILLPLLQELGFALKINFIRVSDTNVVQAFLKSTCDIIENINDTEKGRFVSEPSFISVVGEHLKGTDPTMRQNCSAIVELLSKGSPSRSGRIMKEGIGQYLSWVAL